MTEDEPRQDPKSPPDSRLASLDERLRQAQAAEAERNRPMLRHEMGKGQAELARILSILISYPLGCALIGYAIDRFAGTKLIWVVMLFVGFGAAIREVWKLSKQSPKG